jgi:hypothetical protein
MDILAGIREGKIWENAIEPISSTVRSESRCALIKHVPELKEP